MNENMTNEPELTGAERIRKELELILNLTVQEVEQPVEEAEILNEGELPELLLAEEAEDADDEDEYEDDEYDEDEYDEDAYEEDEYEEDEYEEDEYEENDEIEVAEQPVEEAEELKEDEKPQMDKVQKEDPVMELVNAARMLGMYGLEEEEEAEEAAESEPCEEKQPVEEVPEEKPWLPTAAEIEAELRRIDSKSSLLYKAGMVTAVGIVTAMVGAAISLYMGGTGVLLSVLANLL